MSAEKVRKLLSSLQDDPENEGAWSALDERALDGELVAMGPEVLAMLAFARERLIERGEAEAAARMLDVEIEVVPAGPSRVALLRQRAQLHEHELFDDQAAIKALDAVLALGPDTEAAEARDALASRKSRWKDIVGAYKKHVENDTDPAMIAQYLVSAAEIVLQYKGKGRDREVDTLFEQALSVDPGNVRAIQLYERVLRRRSRWDDLVAHLDRNVDAVASVPVRVQMLFRAARTHAARRGDIAAAERLYRKALTVDPGNVEAIRLIVAILQDRERWDDLAAFYTEQLGVIPEGGEEVGLLVQVGMVHWRMREDVASARPFFTRLAKAHPDHQAAATFFAEAGGSLVAGAEGLAPPTDDFASEPDVAVDHTGEEEVDGNLDESLLEDYVPTVPPPKLTDEPGLPLGSVSPPADPVPNPVAASTHLNERGLSPAKMPAPAATAAPGDRPSAEAIARPAVRPVAPGVNRLQAAVEMAKAADAAGQTDRAIEGWKMVLRLDPTSTEARASLERLYTVVGRWNNLVEMLRQELEFLGGARPGAEVGANRDRKLAILRQMVEVYRDRMSLEPMVVQTYNTILGMEPGDAGALAALAVSYEKLGRFTDVIKVLEQQAEHAAEPGDKIVLLRRMAQIWIERFNNVGNATKPLEQVLALDPTNRDAIERLKELYARRRAWRSLFDVSRREADLLSGTARRDAVIELARIAMDKMSSPTEAIKLWREAVSLDAKTPGALDALEKLTEREKDYKGLVEVLERRADETVDPEAKIAVLAKLGVVYSERLEDTAGGISAWKRVLETRPGYPKAMRVLRDAYTQSGQWDALEELYASAGDFDTLADVIGNAADRAADPEVRVALSFRAARIYEDRLAAPERAFRNYERVLTVDPTNLRAATALVPIYVKEERWARLVYLYEIMLDALNPTDVSGALGYLRELRELTAGRLGDRAAAFRWARRAYNLAPLDSELEATLERSAQDASAWHELVHSFDERAAASDDRAERDRLRDKAATVEAYRLGLVDAAIGRYRRALEDAADDDGIIATLDRLLRRAERWRDLRDLYDHRLARVSDAEVRRGLLVEVARIEETQLGDAEAASARFRAVLDAAPGDHGALEALARLAEAAERWVELAELLGRLRDAASGAVRADLAFRMGDVQARKLADVAAAIESFREVLALSPHHPGALAALEGLLGDDAWRVTAARLLESEFESIGENKKLAWVLQILLDTEHVLEARKNLGLRLANVYGERLDDRRSGFELVRKLLDEQPGSDAIANELARLAAEGGWSDELAVALARIVDREGLDAEARVRLARRTAAVYDDRFADSASAERFHRMVVDSGVLDGHAFRSLKRTYQEGERWDDLRALYGRWIERTPEIPFRIELLHEEAVILEDVLDQSADAAAVYQRILALDESNLPASQSLDRLFVRLRRWSDLATLLTRGIALGATDTEAGARALEFTFRRGEVRERFLADSEGALEDFTAVVATEPTHTGARAGLERLLSVPALRLRAGAVLEPLYESDGDKGAAGDLVRMLLVRLEGPTEPHARAELFRRVAEIREFVLDDVVGALGAVIDALSADPASDVLRAEVLRLSTLASRHDRAAESLEKAASDPRAENARVGILRDLALVYDDRLVDPARAERTYRRVLEIAGDDTVIITATAVALERLYRSLQNLRGLVDALVLRARHEPDPEVQRSLWTQAGENLESELSDFAGAIMAQRARLAIDPSDRSALGALARLYERTGAWTELIVTLREDARLAVEADVQKALLLRAAAVLEDRLADVAGAVGLYNEILETSGPDRGVHVALARLYELSDAWSELLGVLERDLSVATERADRLAIIVRMADLRRLRTGEAARAVDGYAEALEIDPTAPTARAALGSMLGSNEPGVAIAAARALDPVFRSEESWDHLVAVLDCIARDTDDPVERRQVLARASDACEIGMQDNGRAFGYAARELRESLSEPDLRARITQVERLATMSGRHGDFAAVLQEVVPELLDSELQIDVYMKIAGLAEGPLGDRMIARTYYERALDQRPDYVPALDRLESLHETVGAWHEQLAVLRRKIELSVSDDGRRTLLRKQAMISEDRLGDRPGAAVAYEAILAIGFDLDAAQSLERIYAAEARWEDLARLLETQLEAPGTEVVDLHYRLGVVAMDHLDDPERALDEFREVLARASDHAPTVRALEVLGERAGYEARTAEMLEPTYLARMDTPRLIKALEARIAAASDMIARKELFSRLGSLYEDSLGDVAQALETYARLFRDELGDRDARGTMARLARSVGRFDRLAEIYADALEGVTVDDDVTAQLSYETAQILDQNVGDTVLAHRYYRRALAYDRTREEVFTALESLLVRETAYPELLALYREAAERSSDVDVRTRYLFKIAAIDEDALRDLPRAIDDYRAILEIDPMDGRATERLDSLLVRTEAWRDLAVLLERRVGDAVDTQVRSTLRFRLGRLRADKLGDPRAAVDVFRDILEEHRDHADAMTALEHLADVHPELRLDIVSILEPLYRELDDWRKLVVALHVRLAAETSPDNRGTVLREIGRLKETRANDVSGAFTAYRQAFAGSPGDAESRESVDRLAGEHGLWDELVAAYESALIATDHPAARLDLLRVIAVTHDQRRDDPRSAIEAYNRLYALDDGQVDVLDQLEGLHVLLSDWAGHVEVLERKAARASDNDARKFLLHQIGESQREALGNPVAAIDAYRRALDIDPGDLDALTALDALYTARGDSRALVGVLSQRLDIDNDPESRRRIALRLGKLWETDLSDRGRAMDAYRHALEDGPTDPEALLALERLYAQAEAWSDLLDNLRTQAVLATDDTARIPLRLRIAGLLSSQLTDPDGALETYREVLVVETGNLEAIAAVRALAQNPEQRVSAVGILEPIFRSSARWDDLVGTLELKLTTIDDPGQRLVELQDLAWIHEDDRHDPAAGFDTLRRAIHEVPSDADTRVGLERLAAALGRWGDLVTVFEIESRDSSNPSVARDLAMRAAQIAAGTLGDDARATASYRRALEQGGDDEEVLAPIDEIYARTNQWTELVDVLERRVAIATDPTLLDILEVRIAALRDERFSDQAGALTSFRNVLERTPDHAAALAGVERLIAAPGVRMDALDVLEEAYQRTGNNQRMSWLLEVRVRGADLASDRVRLLSDLARLREENLHDASQAFDAWVQAFREDPRDEQVISELERLAPAANAWIRLKGVVESVLAGQSRLRSDEVAALNLRAARWYHDHLGEPTLAEQRLVAALAVEPENTDALEILEGLQRLEGRERDLVTTLRRRAELELDVLNRRSMLREAAMLAESKLHDIDVAADLVVLLLEADDGDIDALDALARLRRLQSRYGDVAELLSRQARLSEDPVRAVGLRREVAELYAGPLGDSDRAVVAYKDLLDFDPNDGEARSALEGILERGERWRDLEDALRGRLDVAVSSDDRSATRLRLAALAEQRFASVPDAVEHLRQVLDEVPSHGIAGRELERLYTRDQRWRELADLLERRAEDCAVSGDSAGELAALVHIGEIHEQRLNNLPRAVELYERVLDRDSLHVGAMRALARIHESNGAWQLAVEVIERALALATSGTESASMALHQARIKADKLDDATGAESALWRALELDASCGEAIDGLKAMATQRGDHAMVADVTERELAITEDVPARIVLLKGLAKIARDPMADAPRAAGYLERALALAPDDREILLPLVDIYAQMGRNHDAVPLLEQIIHSYGTRRTKDLAQWQHRLGRAFSALGDPGQALACYDAAYKIDLTNVPILRDLGLLCIETGDYERAQRSFRTLLLQRLDGTAGLTKADVYYHLGDALHRQGDHAKAISNLERALDAERGHPRATELLARIKSTST